MSFNTCNNVYFRATNSVLILNALPPHPVSISTFNVLVWIINNTNIVLLKLNRKRINNYFSKKNHFSSKTAYFKSKKNTSQSMRGVVEKKMKLNKNERIECKLLS